MNEIREAGKSLCTFQLEERRGKKRVEVLQAQLEIEQHVLQYFTMSYTADPPRVPQDDADLDCESVIL